MSLAARLASEALLEERVDIRAVGDSAYVDAPASFGEPPRDWVASRLRGLEVLRSPDVNFLNFESTVTRDCDAFRDKEFAFTSSPAALAQFATWGFNLIALANNHSLDCQSPAPEREIGPALREARRLAPRAAMHGVASSAKSLNSIARLTVRGVRIGMVSLKAWDNGRRALVGNLDNAHQLMSTLRDADVDVRILSMHGGIERARRPTEELTRLAREFVRDYRGDVVFAHHPHVVQGLELLNAPSGRRAAVFYSLGNHLHPGLSPRGDGMMARLVVTRRGVEASSVVLYPLDDASIAPHPVSRAGLRPFAQILRASSTAIASRRLPPGLARVPFAFRETLAPAPGIAVKPQ